MTEKVGLIKNPLTIIAIFAGIAEVSGTLVLPFIHENNQELFIYFLISFPTALVVLFFVTLNFNNRVLYAPSDYQDETNYVRINKYDISRQKTIEVKVPKDDSKSIQIIQLTEKINFLNTKILKLESSIEKPETKERIFLETIGHEFRVTDFDNVSDFVRHMEKIGISFEIYYTPDIDEDDGNGFRENRAIWLGEGVSLEVAKEVIKESKNFYPHLKYVHILNHGDDTADVYIGGSTKSAVKNFKLRPLENSDFNKLQTFENLASFHEFIRTFKK